MRIAFITTEYPPRIVGGAGTYAFEICSRLGRAGHEVVIFIPRRKGDAELTLTQGVDVHYIDVAGVVPPSPQFWLKLPGAIRKSGPFDIVHLNSFNYYFLRRRRLACCPHVMTLHHLAIDAHRASGWGIVKSLRSPGSEDGFFMPIIERSCVRSSDVFLAVSEHSRRRALEEYDLEPQKVFTVLNGVPRLQEQGPEKVLELRTRLRVPTGPLLLFVGRFEDTRKGADILISAMARLPSHVNLMVVGRGDPNGLEALIEEKGLHGRVFFAGFLDGDSLAAAYEAADICVIPSRMEGFGLSAIHAMATRGPVVASDIGALREVIGDPDQLFVPGDACDLASKIAILLSDGELALSKGNRNRQWASRFASWDQVAAQIEQRYNELVPEVASPKADTWPVIRSRSPGPWP